jgi:hypothetical protein
MIHNASFMRFHNFGYNVYIVFYVDETSFIFFFINLLSHHQNYLHDTVSYLIIYRQDPLKIIKVNSINMQFIHISIQSGHATSTSIQHHLSHHFV